MYKVKIFGDSDGNAYDEVAINKWLMKNAIDIQRIIHIQTVTGDYPRITKTLVWYISEGCMHD